jgi:hypothetical protein
MKKLKGGHYGNRKVNDQEKVCEKIPERITIQEDVKVFASRASL